MCSCERAVIPENRLIAIYHDIFLADAYISMTPKLSYDADSLVAYQEVIERHGYSVKQFVAAQDFYVAHPEDFARMMKILQQQLTAEKKEIQTALDEQRANDTTKVEFNLERPQSRDNTVEL